MNDQTAYDLFNDINERLTDIQARNMAANGCLLRACAHIQQRPLKEVVKVYEELRKTIHDTLMGKPLLSPDQIDYFSILEPEEPKSNGN